MSSKTIIGLSFGNASSSIAYTKEGVLEVIANPDGDRQIPSMLSYVHGDELHGLQAKHQLVRNPGQTVANFRDFLGAKFADIDPSNCEVSAHPVEDGKSVAFKIDDKIISVGEVVSSHIKKLATAAVDYIGKDIDGAVIAVPSNWSDAQRTLLTNACQAADLPVLQVLNEETAALLAYSTSKLDTQSDKLFVVADFGSTRSDAAVVAYNGGIFTTLATVHDTELGGALLDKAIVEHLAKTFESANNVDARKDPRAVAKLTQEAEQIKKTLSNSTSTNFGIESVTQGIDFTDSINRLKFEVVVRPIITRFTGFVEQLLKKANVDPLDITDVLLVGGTSWVPKVASSVGALFETANIISPTHDKAAISPDELIARGCAIQGSLISGFDSEEIAESLEPQVVNGPHLAKSIGYVNEDGSATVVIPEYTLLPIRKSVSIDATGLVAIKVVEVQSAINVETVKEENVDDESDWSDDEYEVRTRVLKPSKEIAELGINASGKVELVLDITRDLKLNIAARSGSEIVKGTVDAN